MTSLNDVYVCHHEEKYKHLNIRLARHRMFVWKEMTVEVNSNYVLKSLSSRIHTDLSTENKTSLPRLVEQSKNLKSLICGVPTCSVI